jgi:N-acetylneuraminic acid mutarotase
MNRSNRWCWPIAITLAIVGIGCGGGSGGPDGNGDGGGADSGWRALEPLPVAIQEIGVVALEGKVYVVGGFIGGNVTSAVHVYDVATDRWDTVAPLPGPIHHANVAAAGGKLYVVGALTGGNFAPIPDVFEYDPASDEWVERTPMPGTFARGASAIGVVNGIIYVAGGSGASGSVNLLSAYDPVADSHDTSLPALPVAVNHLVGVGVGDTFYAIGGRGSGIVSVENGTFAYDPAEEQWTQKAAMPTARAGMAAAAIAGDRIIVVGGEGNSAVATGVFPEAEMYEIATDEWTSLEDMRTPRHGMGAAGVGGTLYVPGGADVQGFGATDVFESFTP